VSPDEQLQLQKENAEADERFCSSLRDMNASSAAEYRAMGTEAIDAAKAAEAPIADAASKSEHAKERLAKIKKGEEAEGGLGKSMTYEECERIMLDAGLTKDDIRYASHLSALLEELESCGIADDFWTALHRPRAASDRPIRRGAERDVLRKHRLAWVDKPAPADGS